jgi:hypothetical protein
MKKPAITIFNILFLIIIICCGKAYGQDKQKNKCSFGINLRGILCPKLTSNRITDENNEFGYSIDGFFGYNFTRILGLKTGFEYSVKIYHFIYELSPDNAQYAGYKDFKFKVENGFISLPFIINAHFLTKKKIHPYVECGALYSFGGLNLKKLIKHIDFKNSPYFEPNPKSSSFSLRLAAGSEFAISKKINIFTGLGFERPISDQIPIQIEGINIKTNKNILWLNLGIKYG